MSTATKFFLGAITLAVVVLLGWWIFSIANKGQSSMNSSISQYDDITGNFTNTRLTMYDNGTAQGSEVMDLINDLDSNSGYSITVINGVNQDTGSSIKSVVYTFGGSDYEANVEKMRKPNESSYYINPMASFKSTVVKDSNDVVTSITFTQDN